MLPVEGIIKSIECMEDIVKSIDCIIDMQICTLFVTLAIFIALLVAFVSED